MLHSLIILAYSASAVPLSSEFNTTQSENNLVVGNVGQVLNSVFGKHSKSDNKEKDHKAKGKKSKGKAKVYEKAGKVKTAVPAPMPTPTAEVPPIATPNPTATDPMETPPTAMPMETPNPRGTAPMETPNPAETQVVDCTEAEHDQQVKDGIITDANEPIVQM
jgi:hypothetical protein